MAKKVLQISASKVIVDYDFRNDARFSFHYDKATGSSGSGSVVRPHMNCPHGQQRK
ncbi:MAG TPA: hypothetical protein VIX37_20095 [Candidatus Sulfotelmatobacter sp.]